MPDDRQDEIESALAAWGAYDGVTEGIPTRRDLAPGGEAALINAFVYMMYFFWLAMPVGAIIGGVAGLASSLVRPADDSDE